MELLELAKSSDVINTVDIVSIISKQTGYSSSVVKQGISQGQLKINKKPVPKTHIFHKEGTDIRYQNIEIKIQSQNKFDKFINLLIERLPESKSITQLSSESKNKFCAFIIEYFIAFDYNIDELSSSESNEMAMSYLEEFYKKSLSVSGEGRSLRKKELIDKLIDLRNSELQMFDGFISGLTNDIYDLDSQKPFQEFSHFCSRKGFKHLIKPVIELETDPILIFQKILKNYKLITSTSDSNERISNRSKAFRDYDSIIAINFQGKQDEISNGFRTLIKYFKKKADGIIGFQDTGRVKIRVEPEIRTYNFNVHPLFIHTYIKNNGTGVARNIRIVESNPKIKITNQQVADILAPGETRKVKFSITNVDLPQETGDHYNLNFKIQWQNDFNEPSEFVVTKFRVQKQNDNLLWDDLKRNNPYGLTIVDDPNKLFGRDKLLGDIRWNIEKNYSITSYVFYGQKRVGKSSIIRTLDTIFKDDPNIIFVYRTIGDVKNVDPNRTLQKLGESIATKIIHDFKRKNPKHEGDLSDYAKPSFVGSLSPLNEIVELIHDLNDKTRVIISLDEFDELNREFFDNGDIGKTFALNIGKGLNEKHYVGFILIGSESMENKTRQGMRLNAFETKKVDTFDKKTEFESYCKIITEPTKSCLTFSADVLDHLFNYTNGNPYYTNSLMDKIFREAYEKRISYIDLDFIIGGIKYLVDNTLTKKDFEHFWNDGLSEEAVSFEKILDRRRRFLTAFAQVKKENADCKWLDIRKRIKYPRKYEITEIQMEDTLNEFKQRGIVLEKEDDSLEVVPKLFQDWLLGPGLYQVIAQLEDKDEILDKVLQEEKLLLSDAEILETLSMLEGNSSRERIRLFRDYVNQFDDNNSKRLIAELLKRTLVINQSEVLDFLPKVRKEIWGSVDLVIGERDIRTDAEIICFNESFEQNRNLAEQVKGNFKFVFNKGTKRISDLPNLETSIKHVIVFEPLIDCPYFYKNELAKLIKKIPPSSVREIKIHIVTYIISDEARNEIDEFISKTFAFDFKIHALKLVQRSDICPYLNDVSAINDPTWIEVSSYKKETTESSCLVKIGDLIPYQCFPILWETSGSRFKALYPSSANIESYKRRMSLSSKLKELSFTSETKELELKASLSEPAPNWKEIQKISKALKSLSSDKVDEIQKLKSDLDKFWLLKFLPQEKKLSSYHVKHAIAKTLAAFSNTQGGTLYVGIDDDFTIQGLVYDIRIHKSNEELRREFDNLVSNYLGVSSSGLFQLDFVDLDFPILRVKCSKANGDVWIKIDVNGTKLEDKKEEFYIRAQQETRQLLGKEIIEWTKRMTK